MLTKSAATSERSGVGRCSKARFRRGANLLLIDFRVKAAGARQRQRIVGHAHRVAAPVFLVTSGRRQHVDPLKATLLEP